MIKTPSTHFTFALNTGNTNTSVGLIDTTERRCAAVRSTPSSGPVSAIAQAVEELYKDSHLTGQLPIKVSSVIPLLAPEIFKACSSLPMIKKISRISARHVPFVINYRNPGTLGEDRIANCLYAFHAFPGRTCIIIDAGTATTIDVLSHEKGFMGGCILPGPSTQLQSLHRETAQLPLVNFDDESGIFPPQSTEAALAEGVRYNAAGGISFIVNKLTSLFPETAHILVCGGAWKRIENLIDFTFDFIPELTLIGIALYEER